MFVGLGSCLFADDGWDDAPFTFADDGPCDPACSGPACARPELANVVSAVAPVSPVTASRLDMLESRVARLEEDVSTVRQEVSSVSQQFTAIESMLQEILSEMQQ